MRSARAATRRTATRATTALAAVLLAVGAWLTPAVAVEAPDAPAVTDLPAGWPAPPEVDAAAYVLLEASTGQVLAQERATERRPVASTIKILTAVTAIQRAALAETVTVGDEVSGIGGASVGLEPGDTWTVAELVTAIVARSGNEAAQALAVHVAGSVDAFVDLMRQDLDAMGLPGITLTDVSGLDDGNRLSAADLATIARVALGIDELRPIMAAPIVSLPGIGAVETRNELLTSYPDATGLKTGFTLAAGNSLVASARRGDRELIAVVLGSGDDPARFVAAAALLDHGFDRYRATSVTGSLTFAVAGGEVEVSAGPADLTVPRDAAVQLRLPVQARSPEAAPTVPIEVDGIEVAALDGHLDDSRRPGPTTPSGVLGRAVVDGAYAALRAGAVTGSLR